jgi:protein-disulfide isomerase
MPGMDNLRTWIAPVAMLAAGVGTLAGCQREDPTTKEKLDHLVAKMDDLDHKLDQIQQKGIGGAPGGAPGRQMPTGPQPGQPDPTAVYSVPIDGDAAWGPPNAKVTLVEAADFA